MIARAVGPVAVRDERELGVVAHARDRADAHEAEALVEGDGALGRVQDAELVALAKLARLERLERAAQQVAAAAQAAEQRDLGERRPRDARARPAVGRRARLRLDRHRHRARRVAPLLEHRVTRDAVDAPRLRQGRVEAQRALPAREAHDADEALQRARRVVARHQPAHGVVEREPIVDVVGRERLVVHARVGLRRDRAPPRGLVAHGEHLAGRAEPLAPRAHRRNGRPLQV